MADKRNHSLVLSAIEGELLPEEQCFQSKLRQAIFDGVSQADVAKVVKGITQRAAAGDAAACRLFFDYVLGAKSKPTQITVNNHFADVEQGARVRKRA